MPAIRVVDLASQARVVAEHVQGWPRARIVAWLGQYGDVTVIDPDPARGLYYFCSRYGPATHFIIDADGRFLIMADHTIYDPRR